MARYRLLIACIISIFGGYSAVAQNIFTMVNNDTVFIDGTTISSGTIYDDGGATGNYSNSFNGWVVITAPIGTPITLSGYYELESPTWDYINVWDGNPNSGTLLTDRAGYSDTLNDTAMSGRMTIYFHTDGSVTYPGFAFTFTTCSDTAGRVYGLTLDTVTANSATLHWQSSSSTFNVYVDGVYTASVSGTSLTVGNLTASSRHTVVISPDGSGYNMCQSASISFRTACGTTEPPFDEDFEDCAVDEMPPCWTRTTNFDNAGTMPRVYSLTSSDKVLMLSSGANYTASHYGIVITPNIISSSSEWLIGFQIRASHWGTVVEVGFCDSTSTQQQQYGFTPVDTLTIYNNTVWEQMTDVYTVPAGYSRLAFRMVQSMQNGTGRMFYLNNLTIESCGIEETSVTRVDTTSAIISWTAFGNPSVTVVVRPYGSYAAEQTITGATSPLTLTGLTPDTRYTVSLQPHCSATETSLPHNLNLKTLAVPQDCEMCGNVSQSTGWRRIAPYDMSYSNYLYNQYFLVSPQLCDLGGKEVVIRYDNSYPYAGDSIVVGTMEWYEDTTTFTPIATLAAGNTAAVNRRVQVPSGVTDRWLALRGKCISSNIYINSVSISACEVDRPHITAVGGSSISVAWDAPVGDSVVVDHCTSWTGAHVLDTVVGINIFTISELDSDTYYYVNVYPICGRPCSNLSLGVRTAMRNYQLPMCEDFEASVFGSAYGWHRSNSSYFYWSSIYSHSGNYSIRFYTSAPGSATWLFAPSMGQLGGTTLSFWGYSMQEHTYLVVGFYTGNTTTSPYNASLFTPIDTVAIDGDGTWRHYSLQIPPATAGTLALAYHSEYGIIDQSMWIDDLQLGDYGYGDFTFANVDSVSADVVCRLVGGATCYTVTLVGTVDGTYSTTDTIHASGASDTLHITGLSPNRRYHCFVAPCTGSDTLCTTYSGSFATTVYSTGTARGLTACNTMDDLLSYELPGEWVFSDSAACQLALGAGLDDGDALGIGLGTTLPHTVITIPAVPDALYLAARTTAGTAAIAVGDDTATVDTTWTWLAFEPSHDSSTIAIHLMGTDTVLLDNVGLSNCPVVTFETTSTTIRCRTSKMSQSEYILTVVGPQGDSTSYHVTDTIFTISGLEPSATYRLSWSCPYLGNGCTPTMSVHTAAVELPYCVDVYSTGLPLGWQTAGRAGDSHWYSGNYYCFYSDTYNPHWQYVILPEVEDYANLHMHTYGYTGTGGMTFEIGVLTDAGDTSTFIAAASFNYTPQTGNFYADLSALPHGRVALRVKAGYLYLQYIRLNNTPYVQARIYRPDTVTFIAASQGTYYLQYGTSSSNMNNIVRVDSTHYDLPTTPGTTLYYRIMPDSTTIGCDGYRYHRLFDTVGLPYCQNFDDYLSYNKFGYIYSGGSYTVSRSSQNNDYYIYFSANTNARYFVMPYVVADDAGELSVNFRYRIVHSYPADTLTAVVGMLHDRYDTTTFSAVDTLRLLADNEWHAVSYSYAAYSGDGRWPSLYLLPFWQNGTMYIDDIHFQPCQSSPYLTATATLDGWNTVVIDNAESGLFYVEYGVEGFAAGSGTTIAVDSVPLTLTLAPETTYDFMFRCTDDTASCNKKERVTTLSLPLPVPACVDFDSCALNVAPHSWMHLGGSSYVYQGISHSGDNALLVSGTIVTPYIDLDSIGHLALGMWVYFPNSTSSLVVGSVINPADESTFFPVKSFSPSTPGEWEYVYVDFSEAPQNAHFVALRYNGYSQPSVDDIHFTSCIAYGLHVENIDDNTIHLAWRQVGSPTVTFAVTEDYATTVNYTADADTAAIAIPLNPLHHYTLAMLATCSGTLGCALPYEDTLQIVAPADGMGCINPTNLYSNDAIFYSGTYNNPYANEGPVDYGQSSLESRHTVCYDTAARDPRTGGMLRTIPEGYSSSVRLGNWGSNSLSPEAEGVIYSLLVDTADFELILLRYAAVLQDPMHAPEDQPRLRIEVLDSAFAPIDPLCTSADFIADQSLGWNTAADNVLWKDWTAVGIDLSTYGGQQVYIRLTTYDCNEGSHYGYAYFTLECMRKRMETTACGAIDSNTFTAPSGFNYRWYTSQSAATISTAQSITRATEDVTYYCDLTKVDNAACMFTINAYGGTRYPMAAMDTTMSISGCAFHVGFTNTSSVSDDGVTPLPGEECESAFWDFGNGQTASTYHASTVYDAPGTYTVMLVSGIAGGNCTDTMLWTLVLDFPTHPAIIGPDALCYGATDTLRLANATPAGGSPWTMADGQWILPVSTDNYSVGNNIFSLTTSDAYGCTPSVTHTLHVDPILHRMDTIRICSPMLPYSYADTVFGEGTVGAEYHQNTLSLAGCDSSYHLWLSVSDTGAGTTQDTVWASICDNGSYTFFGSDYTTAGTHVNVHLDATGFCDSLHYLLLDVRATSHTDTVADECDRFTWYGATYTVDTTINRTLQNNAMCDSSVTLSLTLRHSTDTAVHHYIVENQLPYTWNTLTFTSDTAACVYHTTNASGCDSTITFALTVYPNSDTTLDSTVCEEMLPLVWNGCRFATDDPAANRTLTAIATLAASTGADSVVTMRLHLLLGSSAAVADTIVQNELPWTWNGLVLDGETHPTDGERYTIDTLAVIANAAGCDSTISLSLTVYRNRLTELDSTVCDDALPLVWQGLTFTGAATQHTVLPTAHGADSTLRLTLHVNPTYEVGDTLVFCPTQEYVYEGVDYGGPAAFDAPHLSTLGCDSLVHVVLAPRDTTFHLSPLYSFDGTLWLPLDTLVPGCAPDTLLLRDTTPDATAWWWSATLPDTTLTGSGSEFSVAFPNALADHAVTVLLAVTSTLQGTTCVDTLQHPVVIFRTPTADFDWSPTVPAITAAEVQLNNLSSPADSLTYLWYIPRQPGDTDDSDTTSASDPFYHWGGDGLGTEGDYDVRLVAYWAQQAAFDTSIHHVCTDTATHTVTITNDFLQFPNLVTPNGDGKNDIWRVVNLLEYGNYPQNELWIFNQWGAEVYHVRDISRESDFWDPNSTDSPDGTYYFRFSARSPYGIVKRQGIIEVLRKQ